MGWKFRWLTGKRNCAIGIGRNDNAPPFAAFTLGRLPVRLRGFRRALRRAGGPAMAVDDKVKQIVSEQLGVDDGEVTPTASFVDDLGADSLDTVELVMAFEEAFDIEIPDEDAEKIRTVQDANTYIAQHSKK